MTFSRKKVFDNLPISYWIDSITPSTYPSLEDNIKIDIAIIGGGLGRHTNCLSIV